ncbi:hypothetical protein JCM10908_002567 [Rhodotorula pacifica]|uniref:GPI-anchor transamidase GPI18 n=1 Tax=Rhodotorula pacifica TaxID=1495444 RepID=UPI003176F844
MAHLLPSANTSKDRLCGLTCLLMLDGLQNAVQKRPTTSIIAISLLLRLSTLAILVLANFLLPTWDAEVTTLAYPLPRLLEPFVRWDTVHFMHIALDGYTSDQQSAFLPGLPGLMRVGGEVVHRIQHGGRDVTAQDVVIAGVVASAIASTAAAVVFNRLTRRLFSTRPDFAATATILFLLAPSRPTLHAVPYTEPFSALFTFLGMLLFSRQRDLLASLAWAAGSTFRAQGVVLGVGFFGWQYLLHNVWKDGPAFSRRHLRRLLVNAPTFLVLSAISAAPFLAFEAFIFRQFCLSKLTERPWCTRGIGMSYGWVQREYWNSGFLRYWRLLQLPNFLLAAPVLALSFAASYSFYMANSETTWRGTVPFLPVPPRIRSRHRPKDSQTIAASAIFTQPTTPNDARDLVPFVHLSTFLTSLLFLAHHVQIILRVCVTNPVPFWYAAELVLRDGDRERVQSGRRRRWGRIWIRYCLIWGTASIVLWAVFLPPA